jgi:hypothetical protein
LARTPAVVVVAAAALAAGWLLIFPARLLALQDAPAPAAAGGAQGAMKIVVGEVKGLVQVRTAPDQPWKKAEAGMELTEGAEFRTGPKSSVVCTIPPDQTIVLDRLGTVKVAEAIRTGTKIKTDLVMKYGRTDYAIEAAGREHESTIRSPSSTLAVRGTQVRLYDQPPFAPQAQTFTGLASYRHAKRQLAVGKGGKARGGQGSAETAMLESVVDPTVAAARTVSESALIANEQSRGAVIGYEPNIDIPVVRGGPGPRSDAELVQSLPGVLNFVVRWTGNADVDIFTTVQPGPPLPTILGNFFQPTTVLYPGFGLETAPSGGRIAFNHRGGPNGGQEICFWPGVFPAAVYGFAALNNSQDASADVRFNAFLNGEKLTLYTFNEQGAIVRSTGFRRTLAPDGTEATIALVPPVPQLEDPVFGAPEVPDETADGSLDARIASSKPRPTPSVAKLAARQAKLANIGAKRERRDVRARELGARKGR